MQGKMASSRSISLHCVSFALCPQCLCGSFTRVPMPLVPNRFLFRVASSCPHMRDMPREKDDRLLDLPEACRMDNFAAMDDCRNFADVRLAWNDLGIGLQVEVRGKDQQPQGDASRP